MAVGGDVEGFIEGHAVVAVFVTATAEASIIVCVRFDAHKRTPLVHTHSGCVASTVSGLIHGTVQRQGKYRVRSIIAGAGGGDGALTIFGCVHVAL